MIAARSSSIKVLSFGMLIVGEGCLRAPELVPAPDKPRVRLVVAASSAEDSCTRARFFELPLRDLFLFFCVEGGGAASKLSKRPSSPSMVAASTNDDVPRKLSGHIDLLFSCRRDEEKKNCARTSRLHTHSVVVLFLIAPFILSSRGVTLIDERYAH